MAIDIIARGMAGSNKLPDVTTSDSGKVLTVNSSGEWEAAGGGGGSGQVLEVAMYFDNDADAGGAASFTTNGVTFDELEQAWGNNTRIKVITYDAGGIAPYWELEVINYIPPAGIGYGSFGVAIPRYDEFWYGVIVDGTDPNWEYVGKKLILILFSAR